MTDQERYVAWLRWRRRVEAWEASHRGVEGVEVVGSTESAHREAPARVDFDLTPGVAARDR